MDNKQSGMVTPPIVSPRPIQTQKALSADENWKVVGSPPRRPLMSPPEERERNRVLQENDITTVEGNRNKALATAIGADLVDLADSTISSISGGTFNESSSSSSTASSTSSPASPTVPQHKQPVHRILSGQDLRQGSLVTQITSGDHRTTGFVSTKGISPFDQYSLLDEAPPQPLHYKSSSTGALNDRHLEAASFSLLGDHGVGPGESFHSKSQSLNSVGRGAGVTRGGLRQSGGGLESPLNFSPFIWNGRPAKDSNDLPATTATNSNSNSLNTSGPGFSRPGRSLSFSDSGFSSAFGLSSAKLALDQDDEDVLRYRPPLPTMEEESEDTFEPRMSRARSFSTSAALGSSAFPGGLSGSAFSSAGSQDPFSMSSGSFGGSSLMLGNEGQLPPNRKPPGVSAWPSSTNADTATLSHRRSVTSNSAFNTPVWESHGPFQPLPPPVERDLHGDRQRVARRFSLAPASGFQNYDAFLDDIDAGNSSTLGSFNRHPLDNELVHQAQRRHSVAGFGGSYVRPNVTPFNLATSLESLQLNDNDQANSWNLNEGLYEEDEYQTQGPSAKDLGKGLSLGQLPNCGSLYVVEFKAGRNDLFYVAENSGMSLKTGDLVIVEADRGRDLGKITNDSITPQQIQAMQAQQAEIAAIQAQQDGSGGGGSGGHRAPKEIHPKRIFRLAQASEIALQAVKGQDEIKAMMVCQTKVRQKRLPMEVVDAEYQWDRRKLTFYFVAERRIDFRELVRDLFKIYKTRIWMYAVSPSMIPSTVTGLQSSSPPPLSPTPLTHQQLHQHPGGVSSMASPTSPRHAEPQSSPMSPMSSYTFTQFSQQYQPQHNQYSQYLQYQQMPMHLQQQQHQQLQQQQLMSGHHRPLQPFFSQQQQTQQQQQQHSYPYSSGN